MNLIHIEYENKDRFGYTLWPEGVELGIARSSILYVCTEKGVATSVPHPFAPGVDPVSILNEEPAWRHAKLKYQSKWPFAHSEFIEWKRLCAFEFVCVFSCELVNVCWDFLRLIVYLYWTSEVFYRQFVWVYILILRGIIYVIFYY